jgi:hypothetical protein
LNAKEEEAAARAGALPESRGNAASRAAVSAKQLSTSLRQRAAVQAASVVFDISTPYGVLAMCAAGTLSAFVRNVGGILDFFDRAASGSERHGGGERCARSGFR